MDGIAAVLVLFLGAAMAASLLNSLRQAKRIRELRSDWNQSQHKWLAYQQHVTWEMGQLKAELDTLAPYRQVRDADAEARRLREEAWHYQQSTIARANHDSDGIRSGAVAERDAARRELGTIREQTEMLRGTAQAIRNAIAGYGDEYLLPAEGLLDQMAEEYAHTDPGQQLKAARAASRQMLKNKLAADCDYSEPTRREMAIRFVMQAFNGEVDAILARAKQENWGKLAQQIRDAFHSVNHHGSAFRNARIREEYLEARLNELRWGVVVHELKLREREEQRRIQAQMREEERARREYEKTIKAAEKEERTLQEALAKARLELEAATAEQQAQFQAKLEALQAKLADAEAKHQRAQSMAELTRRGHVYVASNIGSFGEGVLKIGMTRRLDPMDRIKELGDASVPFDFDVHAMIYSDDAPALERELHRRFQGEQVNLVNPRKEFFATQIARVRQVAEELGVQATFTARAEAREYRETLAIRARGRVGSPTSLSVAAETALA